MDQNQFITVYIEKMAKKLEEANKQIIILETQIELMSRDKANLEEVIRENTSINWNSINKKEENSF